jgi:hypothetical protein
MASLRLQDTLLRVFDFPRENVRSVTNTSKTHARLLGGAPFPGLKSTICKPYYGKKENVMDLQDFCMNAHTDLTGWKAKIYDVMRRMDKLPPAEKAKTRDLVNDLNVVVDEILDALTQLQRECPAEWSSERKELQKKFKTLGERWDLVSSP